MDEFKEVELRKIVSWFGEVRPVYPDHVRKLSKSLRLHGQITPVVVEPLDGSGKYRGIVHRHIFEATKLAANLGYPPKVLCRVHLFKSDEERLQWQLVENLHRKDLTPLERAEMYRRLRETLKKEVPEERYVVKSMAASIQEITGEKAPAERTIRKYLQIADELPEAVKAVTSDHFGVRHAEQLLRLKDHPEEQLDLAKRFTYSDIEGKPWTVKKMKQEVDKVLNPPAPKPEPIDTGLVFKCPVCGETYTTIHVEEGKHKLQRITVMER